MKHEIIQSYKSPDDITVITHGRRRPIRLNLESLDEFVRAEGLQLPSSFTVMIDQRSPLQRIRQGDSFYNPQNTLRGKIREALHAPILGMSSRRRSIVQLQPWPIALRAVEESILKHELFHLGKPIPGGISPTMAVLAIYGSFGYYFAEKAYPIFRGLADNNLAVGIGIGVAFGYNISAPERGAIKAQFRKLSQPLISKD